MLDRASTFADKEIVTLLQTKFVPVAIDQAYQRRQKDTEGEFYRKIAKQGPRKNFQLTTQGLYMCSASGKFLGYTNNRDPKRVKQTIEKALKGFQPEKVAAIDPGKIDQRYNPTPPKGGLVIRVNAKVLGGYGETTDRWKQLYQVALSRDNLWITKSEHQALVDGKLPQSIQKRLVRYHLIDNTRGEPPMWKENEIQKLNLQLKDGQLTGKVHLKTNSGDRGFQANLRGVIKTENGQVTQMDIIAKGQFWGQGRYTPGAPKGKFPLAVSFTLADGKDAADLIPPQGSRGWVPGYLR